MVKDANLIGYFKDDLKVYTNNFTRENPKAGTRYIPKKLNHYKIFIILKGTCEIEYNQSKFTISDGQMVFADVNTVFAYNFIKREEIYYLEMVIFPSVLSEKTDDMFFLRALHDMPVENRVININSPVFFGIKSSIYSIINCINKHLGRAHILPRIKSIISDLDIHYDELYISDKMTSDSVSVNIRTYVEHHYMEDISYDMICKKFFVSKPTVIKMFRLNTEKTMHEYIEDLRMDAANKMLFEGVNVTKTATMCGYNNYTTFLKVYKKHFGILPSENKRVWYEKHLFT